MPIFDYQCSKCGHTFEAIQKISDSVLTDCPECGESMLKKMVSAPSFRLKGGGWYETDFKGDNKKKDEKKKESSSPKSSHSCAGGGCACK